MQATRAGADYGFLLVWAILVGTLTKYPFLSFGPRYAAATGENLLEGYRRLGPWAVLLFLVLTLGTMIPVLSAVTAVTAGLAGNLFGLTLDPTLWSALLLGVCVLILLGGRYPLLDLVMKALMIFLALATVVAVAAAAAWAPTWAPVATPAAPALWTAAGFAFLIALMGWMPIPIDAAVWHSLWTADRARQTGRRPTLRGVTFDFNVGYLGAGALGVAFLALGALVMYGSGERFADSGVAFAEQLIDLYARALGAWSEPLLGAAAFITMFSTTLAVTDAYPRTLAALARLGTSRPPVAARDRLYLAVLLGLVGVSLAMIHVVLGTRGFTALIDLATTLSFLTAPLLAWMNYRLLTSLHTPEAARPGPAMRALSLASIAFLTVFALAFVYVRFAW